MNSFTTGYVRRHLADASFPTAAFSGSTVIVGTPHAAAAGGVGSGGGGAHHPLSPSDEALVARVRARLAAVNKGAGVLLQRLCADKVDSSVVSDDVGFPDVLALLHVLQAEGLVSFSEKDKTVHVTSPGPITIAKPRAVKQGVEVKVVAALHQLLRDVSLPTAAFA